MQLFRFRNSHIIKVARMLSLYRVEVEGMQIGPALVQLNFKTSAGRGVMFQYILPIEPLVQKLGKEIKIKE